MGDALFLNYRPSSNRKRLAKIAPDFVVRAYLRTKENMLYFPDVRKPFFVKRRFISLNINNFPDKLGMQPDFYDLDYLAIEN